MSESPHIFEATQNNFSSAVIENSYQVPVLVDFWADWCGPCKILMPMLHALAEEYEGKFILATVNSDEQQELSAQFGIRSIPTVKLFRNGQVVDEFMGAQPESAVRELLERHLERESDKLAAAALTAQQQGDNKQALSLMQQAIESDPENYRVQLQYANLLMTQGQYAEAEQVIKTLPANHQMEPEAITLLAQMEFIQAASEVTDRTALEQQVESHPDDCQARYLLGSYLVVSSDYEGGMTQFMEILQRNRSFEDDLGRKSLLKVFDILGGSGPLVNQFRSQMFNAMH